MTRQWYLDNREKHKASMKKYYEKNKEEFDRKSRERLANNRAKFFSDKCCARCESVENLELDHVKRSEKISHKVWAWSEERRNSELTKCQVLCHDCHLAKSKECGDLSNPGETNGNSKLTAEQVLKIRELAGTMTYREIAPMFDISFALVGQIIRRKIWKHV